MKTYKTLSNTVGKKKFGDRTFTFIKSGTNVVVNVDDTDIAFIESTEAFQKGNLIELDPKDVGAEAINSAANMMLAAMSKLFTYEEVKTFESLSEEAVDKIKNYAFEVRDYFLQWGEGSDDDSGDEGGDKKPPFPEYDDITVAELKELLDAAEAEYDQKANKQELYDLAKAL